MFNEPLYKKRSLGDKMDVTFAFIRENFRMIMTFVVIVSIPFCLILSFILVYDIALKDIRDALINPTYEHYDSLSNVLLIFILFVADMFFITPIGLTFIQQQYKRQKGLSGFKIGEFWRPYFNNFLKTLSMPFSLVTLIVIFVLLIISSNYLSAALLNNNYIDIPFIWVILCYFIFTLFYVSLPAFCVDNNSYFKSLFKSFKYGLNYFFNIFAFSICIFVICMLIFLWEIALASFVLEFRHELIGSTYANHEVAYIISWVIIGIIWIAVCISMNIALVTGTIGMVFQYGHAEDKYENSSLKEKINNFENL